VPKFESGRIDLFNYSPCPWRKMNGFAAPIVGSVFSRDPAFVFEPMQQCNQGGLFDPKMSRDFGLGHWTRGGRQVHQGPPFGLAQAHRLEAFVQFQPPGPGRPVKKRTEMINVVRFHGWKIVSLLTNSKSLALSMPAP